jgi:hypothetical protein
MVLAMLELKMWVVLTGRPNVSAAAKIVPMATFLAPLVCVGQMLPPYLLMPVVAGVGKAFVHHRIEAGVLLNENLRKGPVLAQQNSLESD